MPILVRQPNKALFFKFEVDGEVQVNLALTKIISRVNNLIPIWDDVEELLRQDVETVFEMEGRPRWVPLSPQTIISRARRGFPYPQFPMLVNTGRLKSSLVLRSHYEHIYNKERLWMEFGSKTPYAIYHQSPRPRRKLPRRPFIYIDRKFVSRTIQILRKYIISRGWGLE